MTQPLPFTAPYLLAPMEGVTDPCFRDLVLERNAPDQLGGAFTEFVRVVQGPVAERVLHRHLGPHRFRQPVGLQLMGSDPEAVAASAARAVEVGAPLVDLNFGCPSKGALRGCAGSALLDRPEEVERLVRAVVERVPERPVTAKIRAGGEDDSRIEELAQAVETGGASLLTIHCRTRAEGYSDTADWERLRRAVQATSLPVCGNGGVRSAADLPALLRETGCRYAMVGRAALGDPWIFSGRRVDRREAASFLLAYAESLRTRRGASSRGVAGRLKQLLNHWTAGGLVVRDEDAPDGRRDWLRMRDGDQLVERLLAVGEPAGAAQAEP